MATLVRTQTVTTAWVPLLDQRAGGISIFNRTGADLLIASTREIADASGSPTPEKIRTLPTGVGEAFDTGGNASEWSIMAMAETVGVEINIFAA